MLRVCELGFNVCMELAKMLLSIVLDFVALPFRTQMCFLSIIAS